LLGSFEGVSLGHHLLREEPLADSPIERYGCAAWQFLTELYGSDEVALCDFADADIISFAQRQRASVTGR